MSYSLINMYVLYFNSVLQGGQKFCFVLMILHDRMITGVGSFICKGLQCKQPLGFAFFFKLVIIRSQSSDTYEKG